MEDSEKRQSIRHWAEDDRPREKFVLKGRHALSDAELLAILIGSGNNRESAVDLCKRILGSVNDSLLDIATMSVADLKKYKGIGEAKAISILAALELGRRRREAEVIQKKGISGSRDAYEIFGSTIDDLSYEQFWILLLNRANCLIRKVSISEGGIAGTIVDPKKVFKLALENNASYIILGHNHPSGSIRPSDSDIRLTKNLMAAGNILEIKVLDHIIVGSNKYFSFADEGMMN
ncbi:MAG TPA: DNA repair protein RadC [Bacteroidales bacterium]|nr:DNA repair protein RadC [Bacteroidales bacterium]